MSNTDVLYIASFEFDIQVTFIRDVILFCVTDMCIIKRKFILFLQIYKFLFIYLQVGVYRKEKITYSSVS